MGDVCQQFILDHEDLKDKVCNAILNDDLSEVVITVKDVLEERNLLEPSIMYTKNELESNVMRRLGNEAYDNNKLQEALQFYNKALLLAPYASLAMKYAYSNRSALLFKCHAFSACLKDIQTCISMGCPPHILIKLKERKQKAEIHELNQKFTKLPPADFIEQFLNFNETQNQHIPCASYKIKVTNDTFPKVVASTDIKAADVIALETAFVSYPCLDNLFHSCYYCHKMSLSLEPCKKCCYALFCDEICSKKCIEEYHDIECQFMELYQDAQFEPNQVKLAVQATLKIRKMCSSWSEFIAVSNSIGAAVNNGNVREIYDTKNKFSLLNCEDNKEFKPTIIFYTSCFLARLLYILEEIPDYLPRELETRQNGIRALARMLMYLSIYPSCTNSVTTTSNSNVLQLFNSSNFGLFSFIGKLKRKQIANTTTVGLHKKIALIASKTIKAGMEITVEFPSTLENMK